MLKYIAKHNMRRSDEFIQVSSSLFSSFEFEYKFQLLRESFVAHVILSNLKRLVSIYYKKYILLNMIQSHPRIITLWTSLSNVKHRRLKKKTK